MTHGVVVVPSSVGDRGPSEVLFRSPKQGGVSITEMTAARPTIAGSICLFFFAFFAGMMLTELAFLTMFCSGLKMIMPLQAYASQTFYCVLGLTWLILLLLVHRGFGWLGMASVDPFVNAVHGTFLAVVLGTSRPRMFLEDRLA